MTLLAPGFFVAAILGALAVVALHFIVTREPRTQPLPTARFAPDLPAIARPRAVNPRDLLLMLLRALLVLTAGFALAQPVVTPRRVPLRRIILADHSPAIGAITADDSVRAIAADADTVIAFDSTSLSAALIRGLRAASSLRGRADSLELVIVSPLLAGQLDEATDSIRALWPGGVRLVKLGGVIDSVHQRAPVIDAASLPMDSSRLTTGEVVVHWPAALTDGEPVGAVAAGDEAVVGSFTRPRATELPAGARVVARWLDGRPAAFEVTAGQGCLRRVDIGVPVIGDLVLSRRFERLVERLTGGCGASFDSEPLSPARETSLRRPDLPARIAAGAVAAPAVQHSRLAAWLLAAALLLAVAELLLRRRLARVPA